jgi:hypothetical protein
MPAEQPVKLRHPKHTDLHIFTRETGGWYGGFHKAGKYHRKATKTDHLPTAMALAEDWYLDCKSEIRLNLFEARPCMIVPSSLQGHSPNHFAWWSSGGRATSLLRRSAAISRLQKTARDRARVCLQASFKKQKRSFV